MRYELNGFEIPQDLEPIFPARVVSGVQPSSDGMHLGNYFGAVQECTRLQYEYPGDAFYLIADYQVLAGEDRPERLLESTRTLALDYLALGLNPDVSTLYRQSDVPQVCELMWILACSTRKARLDQAPAYKAVSAQGQMASIGLFLCPALTATDILAIRATDVATGDDEEENVEIARQMARAFNERWGTTFPAPHRKATAAPSLAGVDGRKMSRRYHNTLPVFWTDDEEFEARVLHLGVTTHPTSEPSAASHRSQDAALLTLYELVASPGKAAEMRDAVQHGKLRRREGRRLLLEALRSYFAPFHERRRELGNDRALIDEVLFAGAQRACEEAETTLDVVRELAGLSLYRRRPF